MSIKIGLPPKMDNINNLITPEQAHLVLDIIPWVMKGNKQIAGLTTAKDIDEGKKQFFSTVKKLGGNAGSGTIKLYVQSDAPISESFSNETEANSILNTLLGPGSNPIIDSISDFMSTMRTNKIDPKEIARLLSKQAGQAVGNISDKTMSIFNKFKNDLSSKGGDAGKIITNVGSYILGRLYGNRYDFMRKWRGSSRSTNYSFSIRLYNPNPYDESMHQNNIVSPLTYLLTMTLPRQSDFKNANFGYFAPFYLQVRCPGLFDIDTAVVRDLTVIKGGDDNAIALNNRPIIVDVKISFESLMNVRVVDNIASTSKKDSSLKHYISTLKQQGNITSFNYGTPAIAKASAKPKTIVVSNKEFEELKNNASGTNGSFQRKTPATQDLDIYNNLLASNESSQVNNPSPI